MIIALISLILTVSINFAFSPSFASSSMPITNTTQTIPFWMFSNPSQSCPTFSNTLNLNNSPFNTSTPGVAAVGKYVFLIYKENSNNSPTNNSPLLFKRSMDGGASFSKGIVLAQSVDYVPRIAAFANNVYVIWQSFSPQGIFFVRSTDSGASFEKPIKLGNNPVEMIAPEIAINGKNGVYLVWREQSPGEIFFSRSIDGGKSFSSAINLSNNAEQSSGHKLAVSHDGKNVYVVWHDKTTQSGSYDIFFRRSLDGGASFGSTINLSNNAGASLGPKVVSASSGLVTNNNVYVVWSDATSSDDEILYRKSANSGTGFGGTINLSNDVTDSHAPAAAAYGDNHFYVAWISSHKPDHEILYKRSVNGGTSFGNTINLSNKAGTSTYALIAVSSNNNVNVLWLDTTPGKEDVFFRKSTSGGAGFGCTLNLSDNIGKKHRIDLALVSGGNNIFTTWMGENAGHDDIYFRTSPPP